MIPPTRILLTAALGLMTGAFTVKAATPITALPYTISSPGTYALTGNLTSPLLANDQSAILITGSAGTVVLDLKGYSLTIGSLGSDSPFITGITVQSSNVTIRNGTIANFNAGINVSPPVSGLSYSGYLSNILVENVTFSNVNGTHVDFIQVNSSEISNCTFLGFAQAAIEDTSSQTGNRFTDNTFDGNQRAPLSVLFLAGPAVLKHCHFEVQPAN
jgi:Right handed beta helix region